MYHAVVGISCSAQKEQPSIQGLPVLRLDRGTFKSHPSYKTKRTYRKGISSLFVSNLKF